MASERIGSPVQEFRFSQSRRMTWIAIGVVCLAGGILVITLSQTMDQVTARTKSQALMVGSIALGAGGLLFLNGLRNPALRAQLGPCGIAIIENGVTKSCRWEDIATVWEIRVGSSGNLVPVIMAFVGGTSHMFVVQCRDRKELVFKNFLDRLATIGRRIKEETRSRLLPQTLATLSSGRSLTFGPIVITNDVITVGSDHSLSWANPKRDSDTLHWSDIREVKVEGHLLKIYRHSKQCWFVCPIGEIPNLHIALAAIGECRKRPRRETPDTGRESVTPDALAPLVSCPHCGMQIQDDGSLAGQLAHCPNCTGQFQMPAAPVQTSTTYCPFCSMQIYDDGGLAGQLAQCPNCHGQFYMPG